MPKIIVSDTSCLIVLDKIGRLALLHEIYNEITTTPEVQREFGKDLPNWITIVAARDQLFQNRLNQKLDLGESSAITLALEFKSSLLLLDDLKARKIATELKLDFTGTLGVLVKAKQLGFISSLRETIAELHRCGFHFSNKLEQDILKQSNE